MSSTDDRISMVWELLLIFKEYNMVQIQIVNRFFFSVGGDVGGKGIGVFQSFGHFVTDPTGEKSFPVMIKCNWSVGERIIRLRNGKFCAFLVICGRTRWTR